MWLVPSLARPHNLKRLLKSYQDTGSTTPGMILIDRDDFSEHKSDYYGLSLPYNWDLMITKGVTMGDKVRNVWGTIILSPWIGILNDDHVLKTYGWDTKLISHLRGYNFVTCDDNWMARSGRAAGATLWSTELLKTVGYIFPAGLDHLFVDDLWETLGREAKCWDVDMDVMVTHLHAFRTGQEDATHKKSYAKDRWDHEQGVYMKWRETEMQGCLEKIAALKLKYTK